MTAGQRKGWPSAESEKASKILEHQPSPAQRKDLAHWSQSANQFRDPLLPQVFPLLEFRSQTRALPPLTRRMSSSI